MTHKGREKDTRDISQMRNLGPVCQSDLNAAGIEMAQDLINLGAEQAFIKILNAKKLRGVSSKSCNATYLYALYGAIHDLDWRELPDHKREQFKAFAAELRESGRFC